MSQSWITDVDGEVVNQVSESNITPMREACTKIKYSFSWTGLGF